MTLPFQIFKCDELAFLPPPYIALGGRKHFRACLPWYLKLRFVSNTFWTKIPKSNHCGTVNCTVNRQYFAFELLELTQDCIFKADNPQRTILTGKVRIDATGNFLFNLLQKREKNSEDQIVGHFSWAKSLCLDAQFSEKYPKVFYGITINVPDIWRQDTYIH